MCCIVPHFLKFILIFVSVGEFVILYITMIGDLQALLKHGSIPFPHMNYTLWSYHCWFGISLAVMKLKDVCYLHWWILMTSPLIVGGIFITFLQDETEGFSTGMKTSNYFALNYMLITVFTLAMYSRTLRPREV